MITPIIEEFPSPLSAVELFSIIKDRPYSFFLDSSLVDKKLGKHSFFGSDPFLVFRSKKDKISLEWEDARKEEIIADPFRVLKDIFRKYNIPAEERKVPFIGGGVGYFAYDLKDFVEDLPDLAKDDLGLPDCIIGFYDTAVIYDHLKKTAHVVSSGLPETDRERNRARKETRLGEFKKILSGFRSAVGRKPHSSHYRGELVSDFTRSKYAAAVSKAKLYIKKGDIYQVNLSQRFCARLETDPFELYLRLRTVSPAPFSAFLNFKDAVILSSSPERFLLKRRDYIETRPIKGTRPRGEDAAGDLALQKELVASAKDAAEHIMIVDLERNDLGRVCEYGSVKVAESMLLEKYANVFHLVSTVAGRLRHGTDPIDCLLAAFPGGSITGAPKIRAMEIIEELEPVKRSVYTGAIGYISFDGDMDTSIVIRTFVVKDKKVYFQVGGGIVADSDPEAEYEETLDKARGLMQALGINNQTSRCNNHIMSNVQLINDK